MAGYRIRPFEATGAEYEAVVALQNLVQPNRPNSVASWRHWDEVRDPGRAFQRWLAEQDGQLVAQGWLMRTAPTSDKFRFDIHLHPQYQGRGLAARFYRHMVDVCLAQQPSALITRIGENETQKLHWLTKNGFHMVMRYPVSRLNVADFDARQYADLLARLAGEGIEIVSLADLPARDPNWQREIYELDYLLMNDVPLPEPYEKRPFPLFVQEEFEGPTFLPGGWLVALEGDHYVGLIALVKFGEDVQTLDIAITGVIASHRRRGIATALKVRSIEFAQEIGTRFIETNNEEHNPMYQLNLQLGFEPQPADLDMEKVLG
jgi:GNAT superfamily N-acetyltransferase